MKNKKWIIGAAIVAAIVALYFILKPKKVEAEPEAPVKTGGGTPLVSPFPLKKGSTGNEVKKLQAYINKNIKAPYNLIAEDGVFGNVTLAALKVVAQGKTEVTEADYKKLTMGLMI